MTREEVIHLSNNAKTPEDTEKLIEYFSSLNNRISPNKHTLVFSLPSKSGTSHFRIEQPLYAIFRQTDEFNLIYTDKINSVHLNLCDMAVIHRSGDMHDMIYNVLKSWPSHKIKPVTVFDLDDNETNISKSHNLRDVFLFAGRDKQCIRALQNSDIVETTGRKLKQVFSNHSNNVLIEKNMFNWRLPQWNLDKKTQLADMFPDVNNKEHFQLPNNFLSNESTVISWVGLTSHFEDLKKIAPILEKIHNKYPETVFLICGMALKDTSYEMEIDQSTGEKKFVEKDNVPVEQTYRYRVSQLFKNFNPERIKVLDALNLENYAWFYSVSDIGICLVEHNVFNFSKSSIKLIENLAYNNPTITSDVGGYNDTFEILRKQNNLDLDIINKMACRSECSIEEWTSKLSWFIENYKNENVKKSIDDIKLFIKDYYDIDKHIGWKIERYKLAIEDNTEKHLTEQSRIDYAFAV